MNRSYVIRAAWHMCNALGQRPSRRSIQAITKATTGKAFSTDEIHTWMKAYQGVKPDGKKFLLPELGPVQVQQQSSPGPVLVPENDDLGPVQVQGRSPHVDLESESRIKNKDVIAPAAKPPEPTAEKPERQRKPRERQEQGPRVIKPIDDPTQPEWVVQMRRAATYLRGKSLHDLTTDERFLLAQYHAWRWGNCTKDERTNRKRATEIAAGITNLACHKQHGLMTPDDYIAEAEEVWKQRGCSPWYKPWDITARFDPIALKAQVQQWQAA